MGIDAVGSGMDRIMLAAMMMLLYGGQDTQIENVTELIVVVVFIAALLVLCREGDTSRR